MHVPTTPKGWTSLILSSAPEIGEPPDDYNEKHADDDLGQWDRYRKTSAEKHLFLTGNPTRYYVRPLNLREQSFVLSMSSRALIANLDAVRIALVAVDKPVGDGYERLDLLRKRNIDCGIRVIPDDLLEEILPDGFAAQHGAASELAEAVMEISHMTGDLGNG